jgi:hypothetical protein
MGNGTGRRPPGIGLMRTNSAAGCGIVGLMPIRQSSQMLRNPLWIRHGRLNPPPAAAFTTQAPTLHLLVTQLDGTDADRW